MRWGRSANVGFLAVLVLALAAVGGVVQPVESAQLAESAQPEWSDDLFDRLENAASEYNARGGSDAGFVERSLLRNARINLYVSDDAGAQEVYSLRLDDELHVTQLQRGPLDDPTLRVETTKATVDQIATTEDSEAAVVRAVRNRQIRVERVLHLFAGVRLRIGIGDVLVGVGSVAVLSLAGAKFGTGPILSFLHDVARGVFTALQRVWNYLSGIGLGGIATILTILEKIDLLEPLKKLVRRLRKAIREAVAAISKPLGGSSTEKDRDEKRRKR